MEVSVLCPCAYQLDSFELLAFTTFADMLKYVDTTCTIQLWFGIHRPVEIRYLARLDSNLHSHHLYCQHICVASERILLPGLLRGGYLCPVPNDTLLPQPTPLHAHGQCESINLPDKFWITGLRHFRTCNLGCCHNEEP